MADQFTPVEPSADDRPALQQELDRRSEEILRLRDLLISQNAELGSLKGKVAQLEAGTARLLNIVSRIRSLLPGFVWSAYGGLRRRRGQQS